MYINRAQCEFLFARAKEKGFCGGRGVGKTYTAAIHTIQCVLEMPMSVGGLLGTSYLQAKNTFLAGMKKAWRKMGIRQHTKNRAGHYVVGVKPPEEWVQNDFEDYENIVSFENGSALMLLSFDRENRNRGLNLHYLVVDEAQLFDYERIKKELLATLRSDVSEYDSDLCYSVAYFGSMPWTTRGSWFPNMKKRMATDSDVHYTTAPTSANVAVVGQRFIDQQKKVMTAIEFAVEMECTERPERPDGYYTAWQKERHIYESLYDLDYDPTKPLRLAFDFNAGFTCCNISQDHEAYTEKWERRYINYIYMSRDTRNTPVDIAQYHTTIIHDVVKEIIDYYGHRHESTFEIYGDRNGNSASAGSVLTFFQQIVQQFTKAKLHAEHKVPRRLDVTHVIRFNHLNQILMECNPAGTAPKVRVNGHKCTWLIASIEQCRTRETKDGFEKDKRAESYGVQLTRPHGSDSFDASLSDVQAHATLGESYDPIVLTHSDMNDYHVTRRNR